MAKLPLNFSLVTHIIVIVNTIVRVFEMPWETCEVIELQLLPHLLDLSLVNHLFFTILFESFYELLGIPIFNFGNQNLSSPRC